MNTKLLIRVMQIFLISSLCLIPLFSQEETNEEKPVVMDEIATAIYNKVDPAVVTIQHEKALGSGFIISPDGYILSNGHVAMGGGLEEGDPMKPAKRITVALSDLKKYQARVIGFCKDPDVSLLKIEPESPLPTVVLGDSDAVKPGQTVFTYGSPSGMRRTMSKGILSNIERADMATFTKVFMSDALIAGGNSGGPMFNEKAEVLGINTYGLGTGHAGTIPINVAKVLKEHYLKYGYFKRATIPFFVFRSISDELARALEYDRGGIFVEFVEPDSSAAKSGLESGDIITELDGEPVSARNEAQRRDFRWKLSIKEVGTTVNLKVQRSDGKTYKEYTITAQLEEDDPRPADKYTMGGRLGGELKTELFEGLGLGLSKITWLNRMMQNLPKVDGGVLITLIKQGYPAHRGRIQINDIILEVQGVKINTEEDFRHETDKLLQDKAKYIVLTVQSPKSKEPDKKVIKPFYDLSGKKIALVLPETDGEYYDLIERFLIEQGAEIKTVSTAESVPVSKDKVVRVGISLSDLKTDDFDGILFIGGEGVKALWENKDAHKVVQDALKTKKLIGAIGGATIILLNADSKILKKKITTDPEYSVLVQEKDANYTGKDIEYDGHILTAVGTKKANVRLFMEQFSALARKKNR